MARPATLLLLLLLTPAPTAWSLDTGALTAALSNPARPAEDRARDADRKPVEVMAFLGVEPGMKVVDLIAAGGYFTEVLAHAVGRDGKVYAQNGAYVLKMRDGANDKAMTARLAGNRLVNVERLDREIPDLGLAPDSIDAAITALNFHDIYNGQGSAAVQGFLQVVYSFLKPGAVLGIIDHVGAPGADNTTLHRIDKALVLESAKQAGFVIDGESDLLHNAADDHTLGVFDPSIRGKTDQFLVRLRKPN
jgi:predicted methyltransferase